MVKAMDVADLIITEAYNNESPVSNLKLQKIMYFLNAIHLLDYKTPLITDVKFEKWDYGPTIPYVYSEYESNGGNEILAPIPHVFLQPCHEYLTVGVYRFNISNLELSDINFVKNSIKKFLLYTPFELVDKSHLESQWRDRSEKCYSDEKTIQYYSKAGNRFWEN